MLVMRDLLKCYEMGGGNHIFPPLRQKDRSVHIQIRLGGRFL